ncbi:hydantoinase/oxoprolinase family protein [Psychromarinibacter sp. C21-152]|uniref:Hydantoinase/oxoprolinase family protein n=1 Tax=Psychromarinibacter sediminicola TaxID=3033385 RepID=A0AAE3TA12_9RHOB|nr:hydantoinase/oxoprolinase family protein [Psychromarinibacter sediminicola]MDF0603215.1 hydantoinase/oxoprolinase family protein [Psychromarinibacter sediminicola]
MKIGVDVGGTNTDAVVMGAQGVAGWKKTPTTFDVQSGIVAAIKAAMASANASPTDIDCVMIGTTQFTNAVIERRALLPVGVIRLCLPATSAIPPLTDWPAELVDAVGRNTRLVGGGYEFDGREIAPLDETAVAETARGWARQGLRAAAVTSVFSPMNGEMERRAAEIIQTEAPGIAVSLSSELGQFGLLPRENSTIINASLADLAVRVVIAFRNALDELGLAVPLFISQNDGTLMRVEDVERYPVLTFASGPTNSMRGAVHLAGIADAMVVDIGGTTSDIGMLRKGFPRQSTHFVDVGGVKTNFRMPDVLAVGLGGGSIVRDGGTRLGPDSVGYELTRRALCFGGDTLTATDIAVAGGWAEVGDPSLVTAVDAATIRAARAEMQRLIGSNVERMKTEARDLPLLVVGGGSILVDWHVESALEVLRPEYSSVANAVGAAIAQVAGEVERVIAITEANRERILDDARSEACRNAVAAGAIAESVEIIEVEQVPISYLPGNPSRLRVKAVGDLPV